MRKNIFYCLIVISSTTYGANEMTKAFFNNGMLTDSLVCYFKVDPICAKNIHTENSQKKLQLTVSSALFSNQARQMIQEIKHNNEDSQLYTIAVIENPKKPTIEIIIAYDPQKIVCDYTTCTMITQEKGLIITFYKRDVLEKLRLQTDPLLRTVGISKGKPIITLDCGHGGADSGKVVNAQLQEKDVNLQIGLQVADVLRQKGFQVLMTRMSDEFIPLDKRTTKANYGLSDVFISIHANAALNEQRSGIETYWCCRKSLKNNLLLKTDTTLVETIVANLDRQSEKLAILIHENIINTVKAQHLIVDRHVKSSIAQVLVGTEMPGALLELGFLSNPDERKKLIDPHYQALLVEGICKGIEAFCQIKMNWRTC